MAAPKLDIKNLKDYRNKVGKNQTIFWNSLGVTQSAGSRYESGRGLPKPTAILLTLRESGVLSQADIDKALAAIRKSKAK